MIENGEQMKTHTVKQLEPPITITQPPTPPITPSSLLLTPKELAARLSVPESWIKEKTRTRARVRDADPLPCVRLGRYVRFRLADVEAWITRQTEKGATR